MPPKTPNDIYGFAQKAILHSIFEKQQNYPGGILTANKSRHTTPYLNNIGRIYKPGNATSGPQGHSSHGGGAFKGAFRK